MSSKPRPNIDQASFTNNTTRPNIIHLTWHDVGRFLGCYGREGIATPNVDRLAGEGLQFMNYWSVSSICSPSRVAALTGCYPQTVGVAGLCHAPENYALAPANLHLSHILRDAGWRTALIGWQHETLHDKVASDLGFQEILLNDPCPNCGPLVECTVDWLEQQARLQAESKTQPFFLQLGFFEVHRSRGDYGLPPEPDDQVYRAPWLAESLAMRQEMRLQQANIRRADEGVGEVLAALDRLGLRENTLFVFSSDHGIGCLPRAKASLYDGGIEIPLILRWPAAGVVGGRTCEAYLSNVDFVPSLLDLLDLPPRAELHGESFASAVRGDTSFSGRDAIFGNFVQKQRMIRTPTHKLIWNAQPNQVPVVPSDMDKPANQPGWPVWEFYDLRVDPLETRNISSHTPLDHAGIHQQQLDTHWQSVPHQPEIEEDLRHRLLEWMVQIKDPILNTIPPCSYDLRVRRELMEK